MRFFHFTFLLMALVIFTSCQTRHFDSAKSPLVVPDSLKRKTTQDIAVDGDWLIFFHCDGMDYLFHAKSRTAPDSLHLSLSGNPEPMKMVLNGRARSRPIPVPTELHGAYDDQANSFIVSDGSGINKTTMRGVFESSERFAAKIESRYWINCSLVIGVRKKHRDELEKLRAKADSNFTGILKNSQLGALISQFDFRNRNPQCSKDEVQWMSKINLLSKELPNQISNRLTPAAALFEDENFEPFFGKPLRKIGQKQGVGIAHRLQRTSGCGQISRDRFSQQVFNDVVRILKNSPPLTRNYVMISNAAGKVIKNWLNGNASRLAAMVQTYSETPKKGLKQINALEKTADYMSNLVRFAGNPDYQNQLTASKKALERKIFLNAFDRQYQATGNTFYELDRLSGFPLTNARQYQLLSGVEKEQVQTRIRTRVNDGAMDAATAFVTENKNQESYETLGRWKTRFGEFSKLLKPENRSAIDQLVNWQREETASHLLAGFRRQFNQSYPTALEALSAKVAFEKRMQKVSPELRNLSAFRQFSTERASLRRTNLSNAVAQVRQKVKTCSNETELVNVRSAYLLPDDEQTNAAKSILDALETRLKTVAPFAGYPGAVYLNALYGNDWAIIEKEDRAFARPLARMMQPMHNSGIYDLMALLSAGTVKGRDLKQYMQQKVKNASMSTSMAGFFIIALEHIAPQCLGSNPVEIKRTETWDEVLYSGLGAELSRTSHSRTYHYTIAGRHRRAFYQLGEPASAEVIDFINGLLGQFGMKKDGIRLSMDKFSANMRGLKMAMNDFPCDGEVMTRLEKALIKTALKR